MKKIGDGAEAIIYKKNNTVVKDRVKKSYRLKQIDTKLRKYRTRREAKLLEKLSKFNFTPKLIESDDKSMQINMEFIDGPRLRDVINKNNYQELCTEIGKKLAILHNQDIIHGDLTTSNMIYNKKIFFIDFGLSYESSKIEDKAVDLHLLNQALESKHYKIFKKAFKQILDTYKTKVNQSSEILTRFKKVEMRGRNKKK
ncbi:MAG: KEOPS complex subunit Bud32 [Candidatus Woesearchaeota archaeon]|nr:KEOPS complex subunit Bud32 [Candidatus Woesearchaeota archaeon]